MEARRDAHVARMWQNEDFVQVCFANLSLVWGVRGMPMHLAEQGLCQLAVVTYVVRSPLSCNLSKKVNTIKCHRV